MLRSAESKQLSDVSEVLTAPTIVAMMINAVSTLETSVSFHQTAQCNTIEDIYPLHLFPYTY